MKKVKVFLLLAILVTSMQAIEFKINKDKLKRVCPSNTNEILSYNSILENIKSSVVNISTQKIIKHSSMYNNPLYSDPFFREFFGNRFYQTVPKERVQRSLGSGVIVSEDGYIVTNNHVIENADKVFVTLPGDKKEYEAKIIGKDKKADIAVIKIDKKGLNAITFYDSDKVRVGDVVFAIGNPFGVGQTITHGIVSAKGRNSMGIEEYEDFIQTDAPINPGNSGGALVNSKGELIGINTAIVTRSGSSAGVGFAIPSNMVAKISKILIEKGEYKRGFLGVSITDISSDMASFYNNNYGALVTAVSPNTPADKAGIKRGDLIVSVNGKKVESASGLKNIIGTYQPGNEVTIKFIRDKKTKIAKVKLASSGDITYISKGQVEYKGIVFTDINQNIKDILKQVNIKGGVIIKSIKDNTDAVILGLRRGDIVIQVDNKEITSLKSFEEALKHKGKKRFFIYRNGNIFAVVL